MGKVAVSMLSADFGHLENECRMVNSSCAEWFHLDIMDGVFVPNLSYGFPVIKAIARYARKPMDAHLMTVQPANHYARCKEIGIEWLTVHYEACTHLHRDIQQIHALGMKAGVAINPATPVHLLDSTLPYADMILIMSVNPGYGGQQFIGETYGKINQLTQMRRKGSFFPDVNWFIFPYVWKNKPIDTNAPGKGSFFPDSGRRGCFFRKCNSFV